MKFVFVPGTSILMCIHETRRKDYAAYAAETPGVDETWKNPNGSKGAPVGEGDNEPVVTVNWDDAKAFCAWLSKKEGRDYRLPTDREWSVAVGLGDLEPPDEMPAKLDAKITDQYPWGTQWPPPPGAGNYADHTFKEHFPTANLRDLENYTDGYVTTAPVMSFTPNMLGIYDLGGNVWQWCEEWYSGKHDCRVARGASWVDSSQRSLLSSRRAARKPQDRSIYEGFRCVLVASPDILSPPR
jgi:formylglycine-generating enzyme required for sulfatase activity